MSQIIDALVQHGQELKALRRELSEVRRDVRRVWIKPALLLMGTLGAAFITGWFALQIERERSAATNRAQAREVARQEAVGPTTAAVAEKAARMALEAHDRAREQKTRRLIRDVLAQAPLQRDPDTVTTRRQ